MSQVLQGIRDGVREVFCAALGNGEQVFSAIGGAVDNSILGGAVYNLPEAIADGYGLFAGAVCDRPPIQGPTEPPTTGGQCEGVRYNINGRYVGQAGDCPVSRIGFRNNQGLLGPITGPRVVRDSSRDQPGASGFQIQVGTGDGLREIGALSGTCFGQAVSATFLGYENLAIVRQDGLPDDCGNGPIVPPAPPPQPPGGIPLPPITIDGPDGEFTLPPIGIIFAPVFIDINGTFNIPFTLRLEPNIGIEGTFNITGNEINFNVGGGGGGDGCTPPQPEPGEDNPDPDEPLERFVAVRVRGQFTNGIPAKVSRIDQSGPNPAVYVPDIGLIQFQVETGPGPGNVAWEPPLRVKSLDQILFTRSPWGAVNVRGTPRTGVTWTVTPIRGVIQPNISIEE